GGQRLLDAIAVQHITGWKRLVRLRGHGRGGAFRYNSGAIVGTRPRLVKAKNHQLPHGLDRTMIASMTGFAAAAEETPQGSLAVELKTVNHRYLEFQTRIPEEFRPLEPAMREAVAAKLTRGKVDCRVTFTPAPSAKSSLTPDAEAMAALKSASKLV